MAMDFRRALAPWYGLLLAASLIPATHAAGSFNSTELFIDGSRYQALLEPSSAQVSMSDADRRLLKGEHYGGTLEQVPGSWVRLSWLDGNWSGVVSLNGEMHIIDSETISPHSNLPVARSLQSLQAPGTCGVGSGTHSPLELPTREDATPRSSSYTIASATLEEMCTQQVNGVCMLPEKHLIVDHLFQQKHPDTYQDKVVELLNIIDGFYRNDLNMVFDNLHVEFPSEELLQDSTSANTLLEDLRDKYHGFAFADTDSSSPLMELLSGRDFDGSTVGLAYVGTLCNSNGYATGVTQEYLNIPLTAIVMAHEIGHNFGANHDQDQGCGNGFIMSSWADASATGFSSCSVDQITAKVDSLGNHDACFNYPVDAGIHADAANPGEFNNSTGTTLELRYQLDYQQASKTADRITLQGALSNGTLNTINISTGSCQPNTDTTGFQCQLTPPFSATTLTISVKNLNQTTTTLVQSVSASGANVKDIVSDNNQLTSTLAYAINSSQPSDLQAEPLYNPNRLKLSWSDSANSETGYRIERRASTTSWTTLATLAADSESYTDSSAIDDTPYDYRVIAEGAAIMGESSNIVSVQLEGLPATPSNLQASLPGSGILLDWIDNANNEVAYRVERQRRDNESWTAWLTLNDNLPSGSNQFTDSTAVPGETYQYRVYALNLTRVSSASNIAQIHYQTLPAVPSDLSAQRENNHIELSWSHDSDNTHSIIIERQLDNDGWQRLTTLGNVDTYRDSNLQLGREHHYRLIARNDQGNSAPSSSIMVVVGDRPTAPDNLTAQLDGNSVTLNWNNNDDNADAIIIERQIDNGTWTTIANRNGSASNHTDNATQVGSVHHYRVYSRNAFGDSSLSNQADILVLMPPQAPTGLVSTTSARQVTLTWNTPASPFISALRLERQGADDSWKVIATLNKSDARYADEDLNDGHYQYRLIAINQAGESPASNIAKASVITVPAAPSNLQASTSARYISLRWADNADNELGFRIQRQENNAGSWNSLAETNANITSFIDSNVVPGIRYRYQVVSINAAGTSTPSNVANATIAKSSDPREGSDDDDDQPSGSGWSKDNGGAIHWLPLIMGLLVLRRKRR